jgi:hypothetical protein
MRYRKESSRGIPHTEWLTVAALIDKCRAQFEIDGSTTIPSGALNSSSLSRGPNFALRARLLPMTPSPIQNSFSMIHKSRIPEKPGFSKEWNPRAVTTHSVASRTGFAGRGDLDTEDFCIARYTTSVIPS